MAKTTFTNTAALPTVAIVGRPNVGKSTLFNRIIRRRRAIVGDEPGITRDRIYGEAEWLGRHFRLVDTGGIIPDDDALIPAEIFRQARVALAEADAVIMVVDGRTELAAPDLELARLLQRTGKRLFLAVNKIDTPKLDVYAEEFYRLGIGDLFPVSAEHGDGVIELLEAVIAALPPAPEGAGAADDDAAKDFPAAVDEGEDEDESAAADESGEAEAARDGEADAAGEREVRVAIIGRPNVGKSTLLNALTGTGRAIVSPVAGTTRDAVDELVERDGMSFRFIDTAGIRRKGKTKLMAEKMSVIMARKHLEAADIALLMIDATEGVTALDANIAGYAHESGRSVIIVVNKWDLVLQQVGGATGRQGRQSSANPRHPVDRTAYEQRLRQGLKFLHYAPVLFISASTGRNVDKVFSVLQEVARERRKRVTTAEMNRFLKMVDFERAAVPMAKRVKIYYMTQAATSPPTFILFTDRKVKLHFSYVRFLENQIRHAFGFLGSPLWIKSRVSG
jgi:GTP-binding protein